MLPLLEGRRVSLEEAWCLLTPKHSLLKSGGRSYMICHVSVLMISDKEWLSYAKQHGSQYLMLLKEVY
jgi:hypothetical protein